ncbi:alpha-hydroxy acid oxidase [Streptomyces sp. NPDC054863]
MTAPTLADILTPADAEALAAGLLPAGVERFINGAAGTEVTLRANRAAFDRLHLVPRVLSGVSVTSTVRPLLGEPSAMPVAVAPMAYQRAVHPDGELATARAAANAGIPFTACTFSSVPVEELAATGAALWFQVYWLRDRHLTEEIVGRAEKAGCRALVLTVDTPRMGRRLADMRGGFTLPDGVSAVHFGDRPDGVPATARSGVSAVAAQTGHLVDPALSWADLDRLRARTCLPLVLKGVLDPDDARRAVDHGVDAVIVSNHGGRQLDGAVPALDALPAVAAAVGGRCEVLLDSGIRSGTDVLRALASGADGVLLGRPALWGLAVGGQAGVSRVLHLLQEELEQALTLAGCPDPTAAGQLRTVRQGGGET